MGCSGRGLEPALLRGPPAPAQKYCYNIIRTKLLSILKRLLLLNPEIVESKYGIFMVLISQRDERVKSPAMFWEHTPP